MSGQITDLPILTELSALLERPVESRDLSRARQHLLDWIGCAAAGKGLPAGQVLLGHASGADDRLVFAWGGLGNILEMDDVDKRALLHPGPSIVPAALILAAVEGATMQSLLAALVVGYDATIRLGRASGPGHYAMWHSTGTCGAIGAAAACAHLLNLDRAQTAHAMALAVSQSAGLWHTRHDPDSMGKQLHTAAAARAGYEAAQLAGRGFKGPLELLEGPQGFFAAMCPDGSPQQVLAERDADWFIHDVSFKPWPACRHAHAVIDAALELRTKIDLATIEAIDVQTYADALKFCDKPVPSSVIEAKFSLQHCVAVALLRGAPTLDDFEMPAIENADLSALREKVRVRVGPDFDARYPQRFGAAVSTAAQSCIVDDALGDPENPVRAEEIMQKAETLMAAGDVPAETRQMLTDLVMHQDPSGPELFERLREALS